MDIAYYCHHKATVDYVTDWSLCYLPHWAAVITEILSTGASSLRWVYMGLPRYGVTFSRFSHWDVWTSMFDICTKNTENRRRLSCQQQMRSCMNAWPLHPSRPLSSLPPSPLVMHLMWYNSLIPVPNTPICFCVNYRPLSSRLFHFSLKGAADRVITIIPTADRRLLHINERWFQRANCLIVVYFTCVLS